MGNINQLFTMKGPSTTESEISPKLEKEVSLMDTRPIRLLKQNSAVAQAELTLPKVEQEDPLFAKVCYFQSDVQENG